MQVDGVVELMAARGVRPKRDWLASCLQQLQTPSIELAAETCFSQLLLADFNQVAAGVLPPELHTLHKVELSGPFVLQVDEVSNIAMAMRDRYHERQGANRCLKLSMTDGVQHVAGIEYRPIPQLKVFLPAGTKIALRNVVVRRGLLLLVPETVAVLGGLVTELEAARQRVVEQINQPPRGNRNPRGTAPSNLSQRATAAAWPPDAEPSEDAPLQEPLRPVHVTEFPSNAQGSTTPNFQQGSEGPPPLRTQGSTQNSYTTFQSSTPLQPTTEAPTRHVPPTGTSSRVSFEDFRDEEMASPEQQDQHQAVPESTSARVPVEPFTYLSFLKERFSNSGEPQVGTIKCILTGVKVFHFKDRTSFHLVVYIDDGSLIAEATVDNQVVEKLVGYSSVQLSAAFTNKNSEYEEMKAQMKSFQAFLTNFEGYMDVVVNDGALQIVNMEASVPSIDGWMLLDRIAGL